MDFDREKVVAAFLAESEEKLQSMEQALIAVEADPDDAELLNDIFRVAHTIKGNASALEFAELSGFAHVVEDLLEGVRERQITITPELISLILSSVDALRGLVPAAAQGKDGLSPSHRQLMEKIKSYGSVRQSSRDERLHGQVPSPKEVSGPAQNGARSHTLRVDTAKLDQMLNLTGVLLARNYSENLREEVKKGMREKAEQGIYPGNPPIGYRYVIDSLRLPLLRSRCNSTVFGVYWTQIGLKCLTSLKRR